MKKTKIILALLLAVACLASVLALSACEFTLGGDEEWTYEADDKEGSVELLGQFFEGTYANTNQVVTLKTEGKVSLTETIDGTSSYVSYADGTKLYSFIDGENYICASSTADGENYYVIGEERYNFGYFAYKMYVDVLSDYPESDDLTYSCVVKGSGTFSENEENVSSSETLTAEIKNGDETVLSISASAKDSLVRNLDCEYTVDGTTVSFTLTFVYGTASVTVPDISGWNLEQ